MDDIALTKEQLYEKRSYEALEAELWKELNNPYVNFFDKQTMKLLTQEEKELRVKKLVEKIRDYKIIYNKVIQYNDDDMKLYRSDKHDPDDIVKYVNEYIKKYPQPNDGKTYTCLYICRDYGESGCLYILLENVLCYQSYVNAIKRRFPDFDVNKEYPWRMWIIVRDEAFKKIMESLSNLHKNLADKLDDKLDNDKIFENKIFETIMSSNNILESNIFDK
jgi:hypothetical protein